MSNAGPEEKSIETLQEELKQKLRECTQALVARGGPDALTGRGRFRLHYEPIEDLYEGLDKGLYKNRPRPALETYYPLAAVLAALPYPDLYLLQEDWNEALFKRGPLPLYLHPTADGHYTAMMAESVVLNHLIGLMDPCEDVQTEP